MRSRSIPTRYALMASTMIMVAALLSLPVWAQEPTLDPALSPETGGGLDPLTTPAPLPTKQPYVQPDSISREEGVTVEQYFAILLQGTTGLLRAYGANAANSALTGVRARWNNELLDFYSVNDGYLYGLLAAGMEADTGDAELNLFFTYEDGTRSSRTLLIPVGLGGFIYQDVDVPSDRTFLLDIETERNELSRLESLIAPTTLERRWGIEGFQLPILSALTSPFGAFRTFNGALNTRHTGWDIRVGAGLPVQASAGGVVNYVGDLDIRGRYVMIDHGYSVYTGYAHLSEVMVERGDRVPRGGVLGATGATGRVSGAHFHWEVAVGGVFVDGVQFIQMWQP